MWAENPLMDINEIRDIIDKDVENNKNEKKNSSREGM